jgi:hypothetical protein
LLPVVRDPAGGHAAPAQVAQLLQTFAKWRAKS